MPVKNNIANVLQTLPEGRKLVAVSKFQSVEKILEAYNAGQRLFGENKVQELVAKYELLPRDIQWNMIGHLQSNKVKYIAPFVSLIQSVDSEKLLKEIDKQAAKYERIIPCLLQIHISKEETKFGFSEQEVTSLLASNIGLYKNVRVTGLMGMASFTNDSNQVRLEFGSLKSLFEALKRSQYPLNVEMTELSMGMSQDYLLAIENGSTMIRIGTAIFGERTTGTE